MSTYVTINYSEGKGQDTYYGCKVRGESGYWSFFYTQDFVEDFINALKFANEDSLDGIVLGSSTCDEFFMEEPQRYDLIYDNDKVVGIYNTEEFSGQSETV